MSFKVLEDNEHSFKIKHPDGSNFLVAKAGLDEKVLKKIKGYASGTGSEGVSESDDSIAANDLLNTEGYAPPPVASPDVPFQPQAISSPASGVAGLPADQIPIQDQALVPQDRVPAQDVVAPQVQAPVVQPTQPVQPQKGSPSLGANTNLGQYGDVFKQQEGALGGINKATQDYIKQTADATKAYQDREKALFDSQQANLQKIQTEMDASKNAYMNGHIDPHRLWNNKSIGNKITAGLGLILGGIGSGLTGHPNQALAVIDKMMDRDIEAQRADQDKNKSLFSMNMQRYGNQQAADAATRLHLYNGLQAELQQKAAGLQSAQAQANYQMGMAGIRERMIPLQLQLANFSAMRQANAGGLPANFPTEMMSQEFQDKLVNVPTSQGVIKVPAQSKEAATDFRKSEVELNNIESNLKNLRQVYGSVGIGSVIPGTAAHKSLASATNAVKLSLGQLVNLKRINEYEAEKYEDMLPGSYSLNSAGAMAQIDQVQKLINNSRNASYSGLLNNYNPGGIKESAPKVK